MAKVLKQIQQRRTKQQQQQQQPERAEGHKNATTAASVPAFASAAQPATNAAGAAAAAHVAANTLQSLQLYAKMAKLTVHWTALQLANVTGMPATHMPNQQAHYLRGGNSGRLLYVMLAALIYGCLLLHAAAAANATASTTATKTTITATVAATPMTTQQAYSNLSTHSQKRDVVHAPDDEYDVSYSDDMDDLEALINNKSAKGKYIGAPCNELKCDAKLLHVACDKDTLTCNCERNYPVQLGVIKGCAKPKKLGEQCFSDETCMFSDENSLCVQVRHNAMCQCANGFHSVSYTKPTKRVFCTQDLSELSSDLPTLLGVSTGIAVLAGLICMVLHLFSKTKYPRHRNYADANIPPPILYSSDTGIPLTVHSGRPSSRSSIRSTGSIGSFGNRRASGTGLAGVAAGIDGTAAAGSKGILVSTSRTGSRRPSLASVHSTSSSVRSYSMMRFEKETQQKEIRQEMKQRLARLQQQQHLTQNKPQIIIGEALLQHGTLSRVTMATPSPLTPNSLDELLPALDENQEYPPRLETTFKQLVQPATHTSAAGLRSMGSPRATAYATTAVAAVQLPSGSGLSSGYHGPCRSSNEAL